jgi:alkaline phosphatase
VGNHCVENLTKPEFLGIVGQERSYYSFDKAGYHFVILDACFTSEGKPYGRKNFKWADAKIPPAELEWLQDDLGKTPNKSIVCVHQCLDVMSPFGVKNGSEVRKVLQDSGKALAVLQGHYHWGNYQEIGGLHYCTMSAVIEGSGTENNAYAMLDILPGDAIRITGFRKQKSHRWPQA